MFPLRKILTGIFPLPQSPLGLSSLSFLLQAIRPRGTASASGEGPDFRAFAASKAFQGGVSQEQILLAYHWKSHNTFTQFYLKDVALAYSDLYHLGPIVATQQIWQ